MANDDERHKQTLIKPPGEDLSAPASPVVSSGPGVEVDHSGQGSTRHRDPVIGSSVSGYVVKGRLGSGGMGIVYEAEQPVIGKRVAIKVLRPEVADNPDVVQRLVAEARAVNQVGHRGIIDVFAFGELPDGRQCIVMEYLDGESLDAIVGLYARERRLMPVGDVLIILDEILSGLGAAHAAGVIHRDLKPSNIFLCRQRDGARYVKLLDFGIAKLGVLGGSTPVSRASLMVGTPSYMAPEQARGGNVGPAMDLYAVGVMAFELFTGRLPFLADSVVAMIMAHQSDPPPRPSSILMSLPDGIDELVLKLLAKKPEDRFQTAEEVRELVVALRQEHSDSTTRRMQLEVTISEKDKRAAGVKKAKTDADALKRAEALSAAKAEVALAAQQTVLKAPEGLAAAMQTAVTPRRPEVKQGPEQVAPTQPSLPPAVAGPELDQLPKSNRGLIAALAGVVLLLGVGVAALSSGGGAAEAAKVDPPAAPPPAAARAKVDPPVPPALPPPPTEVAKLDPPAPATAPAVMEIDPRAAPVPPPAVPEVGQPSPRSTGQVAKVKSAPAKPGGLRPRLRRLEARLEKAAAAGASVDLYLKQVQKIQALVGDPSLSDEERDRLESAVLRLEQSRDY